jgi:beta-galactosidase
MQPSTIARLLSALILVLSAGGVLSATRPRLDLTGTWEFYPDVGDASFEAVTKEPGQIQVPGAWQAQGYGKAGGTIPSANIGPGTSPAEYLRHNLMARCLYVRQVLAPPEWRGRRVFLCVRRAYRYTDASVNGKRVGEYEGFCSPFEFDITDALNFGQTNRLVLGVDNRPRPGRDTLGTGNLYGNWGGIGGAVYLEARSPVWLDDVFVMPRIGESLAVFRIQVKNPGGASSLAVRARITPWSESDPPASPVGAAQTPLAGAGAGAGTGEVSLDLPVPIARLRLWTPEEPYLYVANVQLWSGTNVLDETRVRFGMREITAVGRKLFLNGKPLYLSGYGDDATEPITGMLPADKAVYRHRLSLMRSLGFNFVRHHSCVPHDEYFDAADEAGMLVQPEAGLAYTGFWGTGHRLFEREWPHIIRAFRNHPSIWAWCMGNELFLNQLPQRAANGSDRGITRPQALELLERAYRQAKELDPTRLVHASDGGTPQPFTDVLSSGSGDQSAKPFLLHEYGTYCCSLPDFSLIPRLNGVIRPLTYERAEAYVREHGLAGVYPALLRGSLLMRAEAQKYYIESAKASGSNSGYSFWLGVDFPDSPEGCWDEGMLNQLWEPKPYLTNDLPDLNGPTVLLATAGLGRRSFYADQPEKAGIRLWHYGLEPIRQGRLIWRVKERDQVLRQGRESGIECGLGETKSVAEITVAAPNSEGPHFLTAEVELWEGTRRITQNSWQFYAYPRMAGQPLPGVYSEAGPIPGATQIESEQALPEDVRVLITRALKRDRHKALLRRGHTAVLLLGTGGFKETRAGYFLNQYGTGFGGVIEKHPMFAGIPHDGRLNPGLYQLVAGGGLLDAESMPPCLRQGGIVWGLRLTGWISPVKNLRKVVQVCDVLADNRLHLVLCDLDLLSDRPECRYVLSNTLQYLLSSQASPLAQHCAADDLVSLLHSK